jgi:hypothetical protein
VAGGGDGPGDVGRAGDGAGGLIDGEVIQGEPAVDGRLERPGLDDRLVPGPGQDSAQVTGAVGRVAVNLSRRRFAADQFRGDRGIAVVLPGGLRQLALNADERAFRSEAARYHGLRA